MLHEMTYLEEEEEGDAKESVLDCFEDEGNTIANVQSYHEFRDDEYVWGATKAKDPVTTSFNEVEQPTFYHMIMMPKT